MPKLQNLDTENRCDYLISTQRKQIWACLLDLLFVVDRICKEHDIKYYAIGGTLLGAVRHNGFIPWDDDLDIAMLRKDYNRFLEVAQNELSGKYFLQTTLSDVNYYKEHARLRNSDTTGICEHLELHGCNNGIYLDILPLENFSNTVRGRLHSNICRTLGRVLTVKVHHNTRSRNSIRSHLIYGFSFLFNVKITHRFREWLETKNSLKETSEVTLGDVWYSMYSRQKLTFNLEDFREVIELPFEIGTIPAPVGYHNILSKEYGDYMKFPPLEKRGLFHNIIFDPNIPYKEYIEQHYDELVQRKYKK